MKIAFLSDAVHPYNKGGKERRLYEISTRLAQRGHDVHIYTMQWWKGAKKRKENGVTLHAISPLYNLYTQKGKRSIKEALLFSLHVFPNLLKEDFDILDVDHMPYFPIFPAWIACKIKRKKIFVTWHEHWGRYWFKYLGWRGFFGYSIEKMAVPLGRKIAISELTRAKISSQNISVIPCGIDLQKIAKAKRKKSFDILFIGRLIKEKNVSFLIDIVRNNYTLGIIGTGPEGETLKKQAKAYPNIHFLGSVKESTEVYGYLKGAKLLAFPSEREGFGIVVLEALACGTPVLTLDAKENAAQYLVEKNFVSTKKEFKEKLHKLVSNPSKIKFDAQKYDWGSISKRVEEMYQQ